MADEKSCGAIVFTYENGTRKYVMVRGTGIYQAFYGFPKGHMEAGETEQETALREVKEETGLDVKLIDGFRQVDEHFLAREGRSSDKKTNVYFLAEYQDQELKAQESEVSEAVLMNCQDAMQCLQSEGSKRELAEAEKYIDSYYEQKQDKTSQLGFEKGKMKYRIEDLTKEDAEYISKKISDIVPREVDADAEEFVLKIENENGEIIGGCVAEVYEYHWSRMLLEDLWVDERYRHQGIGSTIIREAERIAREKGCRVVTLGTSSYMARPFYEKHGYTVFSILQKTNGYLSYSLVKYLDKDTPDYVPTNNSGARFKVSFGSDDDAEVIVNGLDTYCDVYEQKSENVGFYKKLVDEDGAFVAGMIADVYKGEIGSVDGLFVEEPLRHQGLGTYFLQEVEKLAKKNSVS
ncbi:MAG: GNAT family N-acetyltransferase [Oscillospiraceae bacterium]|nr:GNAT family N-acetyltransferase [Oscillospiraceae bacterium]